MRALRHALLESLSKALAVAGVARRLRARRRARGDFRVCILEYHDVGPGSKGRGETVSAAEFRRHLELARNEFRVVSLSEAVARLRGADRLPEDLLVLTFDDGRAGNHENAWAALQELGLPATVFLATGFLDTGEIWFDRARCLLGQLRKIPASARGGAKRMIEQALGKRVVSLSVERLMRDIKRLHPSAREALIENLAADASGPSRLSSRALSWEQVREMAADGIEFGCHTVTHPILSTLSAAEQRREILDCRRRIEQELGKRPLLFAYPNGAAEDFSDETVQILRELGMQAACTTLRGSNRPLCDLFRLRRIGVGDDSAQLLDLRLAGLLEVAGRRPMQSTSRGEVHP